MPQPVAPATAKPATPAAPAAKTTASAPKKRDAEVAEKKGEILICPILTRKGWCH